MTSYMLSRMARAAITLLLIVSVAFVILRLSGDPALLIMSPDAPPEVLEQFRKAWGLDQPIWVQYLAYLKEVAKGNLGESMFDRRSALAVVLERVPATLSITFPAFLLKLAIGIPAGAWAALHRNSSTDRLTMIVSVAGYTIPSFVLGLVLVLVFSVWLGVLPSGGGGTWRHAILPIVTLGLAGAAIIARFTRSAMLEVLGQPYIRAARAKGVPWRRVVFLHALPNAAIPIVTLLGFLVGNLIAGAVLVENVFAWPGIGRLLVNAVASRDLAVVQMILLLVGATMVAVNLLVDLAYGWIDPRMRSAALGEGRQRS